MVICKSVAAFWCTASAACVVPIVAGVPVARLAVSPPQSAISLMPVGPLRSKLGLPHAMSKTNTFVSPGIGRLIIGNTVDDCLPLVAAEGNTSIDRSGCKCRFCPHPTNPHADVRAERGVITARVDARGDDIRITRRFIGPEAEQDELRCLSERPCKRGMDMIPPVVGPICDTWVKRAGFVVDPCLVEADTLDLQATIDKSEIKSELVCPRPASRSCFGYWQAFRCRCTCPRLYCP